MSITYQKFSPYIDVSFWKELSRRKLEEWKLDESAKTVYAKYQVTKFKDPLLKLNFDVYSFNSPNFAEQGPLEVYLRGKIKIFNTIEDFKGANASTLVDEFKEEQTKDLKTCFEASENCIGDLS